MAAASGFGRPQYFMMAGLRLPYLLLLGICMALQGAGALPKLNLSPGQLRCTTETTATFTFLVTGAAAISGYQCRLDGAADFEPCTSPHKVSALQEGRHTIEVRGVGPEDDIVTATEIFQWTVDTSEPRVEIVQGPGQLAVTANSTALFEFRVEDSPGGQDCLLPELSCWLDNSRLDLCQSPMTLTGLAPRAHAFQVEATDTAGNSGKSSRYRWEVEPLPKPRLSRAASGPVNGPFDVTFSWSSPAVGFGPQAVIIGGAGGAIVDWKADGSEKSFRASVAPVGSGDVTVQVEAGGARSQSGVPSPASSVMSVACDLEPPTVTIQGVPQVADGPFQLAFQWSEPVRSFAASSIVLSGAKAQITPDWTEGTEGTRFAATVTPMGTGTLSISVGAKAAADGSGNLNLSQPPTAQVQLAGGQVLTLDQAGSLRLFAPGLGKESANLASGVTSGLIAALSDGILAVASRNGTTVQTLGLEGELNHTVSGFNSIAGLSASGQDTLLVVDSSPGQLVVLDSSLGEVARVGGLSSPAGVATDAAGFAYVADSGSRQVVIFDDLLNTVGSIDMPAASSVPVAVEVSGGRRVYVACTDPAAIEIFDAIIGQSGAVLSAHIGTVSSVEGGGSLLRPVGLAADGRGSVYVADKGWDRLLVLDDSTDSPGLRLVDDMGLPAVAVAVIRDRVAPTCRITGPEGEQHSSFAVSLVFSEPLAGLREQCIRVSGPGGALEDIHTEDQQTFTATVVPFGVGTLEISLLQGCVLDTAGNMNLKLGNTLTVEYFGGQCSVDLGCRWELAKYEHQLAEERLRLTVALEAEKERAKVAVQQAAEDARALRRLEAEAQAQERQLEAQDRLALIESGVVRERAAAEADGRIKEARDNEELRLRELRAQAEARREMVLSAISAVAGFLESGFTSLVSSPATLRTVLAVFGISAILFFVAREGARVVTHELARLWSRPPLVRETNKLWLSDSSLLSRALLSLLHQAPSRSRLSTLFKDVVLEGKLHNEVEDLAGSIALAASRGVPLRNVLFWGPPGTGKTMAAQRMARGCGLGYAMMSGGDVVPLGKDAVTELHAIFNWAERSPAGVLLFIDEADAFLRRRKAGDGGSATAEQTRAAINAVLARTSSQSNKIMMVLASNRPEDLDAAVLDRIDDTIHFPLPGLKEREHMLKLYFTKYLGHINETPTGGSNGDAVRPWSVAVPAESRWAWKPRTTVDLINLSQGTFQQAAKATDGFSGRELAKLMIYVQSAVYGETNFKTGKPALSSSLLLELVDKKAKEHKLKAEFQACAD